MLERHGLLDTKTSPFGCLLDELLATHLWHSSRDHVPNVDTLNKCNTSSVESQLRSKRLRWLGHTFRMPNDRLLKTLLFGQVKGTRPSGRPTPNYNDVASSDCHECRITRPYKDAQNRLLWRVKTCPTRTWLIMSWESVLIIIIRVVMPGTRFA